MADIIAERRRGERLQLLTTASKPRRSMCRYACAREPVATVWQLLMQRIADKRVRTGAHPRLAKVPPSARPMLGVACRHQYPPVDNLARPRVGAT